MIWLLCGGEKGTQPKHREACGFLVLGRQPGSDPEDYKTWGPLAVVIDPWAAKVYPLSEVEKSLQDFIGVNEETGKPRLRPFNPEYQKLIVNFGNICSSHDISRDDYPEIVSKLEEFHQEEGLQEEGLNNKVAKAKELYRLCSQKWEYKFSDKIQLLKAQVDHFIELMGSQQQV